MTSNQKDIHRYSHSRLSAYKQCPRKHHYIYIEQIETPESKYTIPGKLFHKCLENYVNGVDNEPVFKEFRDLCQSGKLDLDRDLLEYVFTLYTQYYHSDYILEETLMTEKEFVDSLDGEDIVDMVVDRVYRKSNYITVRDTKTTEKALKYDQSMVQYNSQLLLYVPYVENELNEKVDAIEIDEVRLAFLVPPPLKSNGKPTINKNLLNLTTYEAYRDMLEEMELIDDPEYQPILEYLEGRGHPLFNRVKVQILDNNVVAENSQEFLDTYEACKLDCKYRVVGPLCNYCQYKDLCDLDRHVPDYRSREVIIDKIMAGK